jgi:DNA-binding XRE family transcriptional regulator
MRLALTNGYGSNNMGGVSEASNTSFRDYFKEVMQDPEERRLYREVLEEELRNLLVYLRKRRRLTQQALAERLGVTRSRVSQMEASAGLSTSLEALARYAQALGLSLRLEFADEDGEVLARYSLSPDEPLGETPRTPAG